jgi:hypothetical protein
MEDYDIPGAERLDLHHFYRPMAWLGDEPEAKPTGALAPRRLKDLIEEELFDRRRHLFTGFSAVFMDTTSLSSCGEGRRDAGRSTAIPRTIGYQADNSRPHRRRRRSADLHRNVAGQYRGRDDALTIVDRLRERFSIGRVCVVADRSMISAATITGLEERPSNTSWARASDPTRSQ